MDDLLVDPHKILNGWNNYICQLLNVHGSGGVRQTEMHTAESSVPEPSTSEAEAANGKLKKYKSPGQIPAGGQTLHPEVQKLNKLIWNEELPRQQSQLSYQWRGVRCSFL
jgi:hypothetical protein